MGDGPEAAVGVGSRNQVENLAARERAAPLDPGAGAGRGGTPPRPRSLGELGLGASCPFLLSVVAPAAAGGVRLVGASGEGADGGAWWADEVAAGFSVTADDGALNSNTLAATSSSNGINPSKIQRASEPPPSCCTWVNGTTCCSLLMRGPGGVT